MSEMADVESKMESKENQVVEEKPQATETQQVQLVDVPITNENVALNVLVGFVNLAQKRGVFNVQ